VTQMNRIESPSKEPDSPSSWFLFNFRASLFKNMKLKSQMPKSKFQIKSNYQMID
jgi:hypothetical protein